MTLVRLPDGTEVPALGQGTWHMGERGPPGARGGRGAAAGPRPGHDPDRHGGDVCRGRRRGGGGRGHRRAAGRGLPGLQGLSAQCRRPEAGGRAATAACSGCGSRRWICTCCTGVAPSRWRIRSRRWSGCARPERSAAGASPTSMSTTWRSWPGAGRLRHRPGAVQPGGARDRVRPAALLPPAGYAGDGLFAGGPGGYRWRALLRDAALRRVAARHGVTPAQAALAWTLRAPGVISIPKAAEAAHVRENAAARDLRLTPEDRPSWTLPSRRRNASAGWRCCSGRWSALRHHRPAAAPARPGLLCRLDRLACAGRDRDRLPRRGGAAAGAFSPWASPGCWSG